MIGEKYEEQTYLRKVYAGILGKIIGVRLGAPVEPLFWTADKIAEAYGEITRYIKSYKNFAADDDINGPLFFIRSVEDVYLKNGGTITAKDIGDAWLNYTAEGHGMFWWGGYGTSTEHTAYVNMRNGILPPVSGSIAKNGEAVAEQIGGQIFVDSWGLVCPGDPERAAKYAGLAASVSHDRNAVFGGQFIAACISLAFTEKDIETVFLKALESIPPDCSYALMAKDVYRVWQENSSDWRETWMYIKRAYSDKKYPGIVHIIPNGAVVICALLYGAGNFSKTITIATMCGWDTDCNAGNVGTIVGVLNGLDGIEEHWRVPVGDFVVTSGIIGSENNLDIPSIARYLVYINHILYPKQQNPQPTRFDRSIRFDFSLPGATHGLRSFPENRVILQNSDRIDPNNKHGLHIRTNFVVRNSEFRVFYKPFYRRKDFDDERYIPNFSPTVYPGQTLRTVVETGDIAHGQDIIVKPYIQDTEGKQWTGEKLYSLENGIPLSISFTIPSPLEGAVIEEVGLKFFNSGRESFYGSIFMSEFRIDGKAHYTIEPSMQTIEFGTVTPFTWHKGYWSLPEKMIQGICSDEGNLYTGSNHWKDFIFRSTIQVPYGEHATLLCRVRGNQRYYCFGFDKDEVIAFFVDDSWRSPIKKKILQRVPFAWNNNDRYSMEIEARGDLFVFRINRQPVLTFRDTANDSGMVGYRIESGTRILIHTFEFMEL